MSEQIQIYTQGYLDANQADYFQWFWFLFYPYNIKRIALWEDESEDFQNSALGLRHLYGTGKASHRYHEIYFSSWKSYVKKNTSSVFLNLQEFGPGRYN